MKRGGLRGNGGFTLAEVIVVMAVIGIFAAVASLSMVGFIVQGSQISRTNVARTLYLAAQNQLTELRITKGLESAFEEYHSNTSLYNVSAKLGANFPDTDENKDNVYYISKPMGIPHPDNPVFKLLAPQLIDPQVLQGAILIEFNVKTGVVMSVFYSDALADGEEFEYKTDDRDPANISGGRGMRVDGDPGYEWAEVRRQGYYGVGSTGSIDKLALPALINVRDSYSPHSVTSISSKNILFAEILIPEEYCSDTSLSYDLLINGVVAETVTFNVIRGSLAGVIASWDSTSVPPVYRDRNDDLVEGYERFIWVLDIVTGNTTSLPAYRYSVDKDKNIRVGIRGGDKTLIDLTSVTEAHPYFLTEGKSAYGASHKVASERHLYNIRYAPADGYTLVDSITMSEVTNFAPIPGFTGLFNGVGNEIIDLKSQPVSGGAGLFESIAGETDLSGKLTQVSVLNLTLTNPVINGTVNAGALCGYMNAYVTGITVNNPVITGTYNVGGVAGSVTNGYIADSTVNSPSVTGGNNVGGAAGSNGGSVTGAYISCEDAASSISGTSNVGGVAGQNDGKILDCTFISPNDIRHITGTSNTGGVAGSNGAAAEIKRVLFLALAPENGSGISPIAGANANADDTKLEKLYYLCGEGVRPEEVVEYNTATADIGTPIGTFELFSENIGTGWILSDSPLTEEQITSVDNTVYPYPYFNRSETAIAKHPDWPITAGVELGTSSFSYYEKYSDNSYGFWTLADGYANRGTLDDDKKVAEAGYVLFLDSAPVGGTYYLFAKPGDSADSSWTSAHRVTKNGNPISMSFNASSQIAQRHGQGKYAYILPLAELTELSKNSVPLQVAYIANINGGTPDEGSVEFIQPLFAKGLYGENPNPRDPKNFYIRTPWQMSNSNVLVEIDKTEGKTFIQERDIDFAHKGSGVEGSYTQNVVSGEFKGTYIGKEIGGFNNNYVNSYTDAGLFKYNSGSIRGIILNNSVIRVNSGIVGCIAGTNAGEISDCELNGVVVLGAQYTGGVTGKNLETGVISNTKLTGGTSLTCYNPDSGGIAGSNAGKISDCELNGVNILGSQDTGGVTGKNLETGVISNTKLTGGTSVTCYNAASGGIAGSNAGEISDCELNGVKVSGGQYTGGITGKNSETGEISNARMTGGTSVTGNSTDAGGIAGTNAGEISDCELNGVKVSGSQYTGGVTGKNSETGLISNARMTGGTSVTGNSTDVGGISATNAGEISGCELNGVKVSGSQYTGGVTGKNSETGVISNARLTGGTSVTSNSVDIGGIAGTNANDIEQCEVSGSVIIAVSRVGGITGNNTGSIVGGRVENTEVKTSSNGEYFGGIAGISSNTIDNCRVVSVDVRGMSSLGGIAGSNTGSIANSCVEFSTVKTTNGNNVGGIVGNNQNSGTVINVYFMSTATLENAPISSSGGGIAGNNSGSVSYALYLAPAPKDSNNNIYPIIRSGNHVTDENNKTTCFYLVGHRYSTNEGKTWDSTPYNRGNSKTVVNCVGGGQRLVTKFIDKEWLDYVFEVNLSEWFQPSVGYPYPMISGMTPPEKWVEADSPARPEQVDKDEWGTTEPTSNRAASVKFGNGDFTDSYTNQVTDYGNNAMGINQGMTVRVFVAGGLNGWKSRVTDPAEVNKLVSQDGNDYNVDDWIELQEPINNSNLSGEWNSYHHFMYTDHLGNYQNDPDIYSASSYRYAELNAEKAGTLYQICPTTPGQQFYYSLYHTSNISNTINNNTMVTDQMNFYLTGVDDDSTGLMPGDTLTLIRPCWSPRSRGINETTINGATRISGNSQSNNWNPSAKKTVVYEREKVYVGAENLSYYSSLFPQMEEATYNGIKYRPYLYDVWLSDLGYGITFWSKDPVNNIPESGVANISNLSYAVRTNIIGYWGISYGWKHYYGLYEVPAGQNRTEFAFQSRKLTSVTEGNYLDGISFKSPAFVSVDKYIRMYGKDVKFVKPGDTVTVELNVKSWGEVPATNIVISDEIYTFSKYIEVVEGSIKISSSLNGSVSISAAGNISATINGKLAKDEEVKITFDVKVLEEVLSSEGVSTLLFYFKNQANVTYNDSEFEAFMSGEKENNSGVVQVHIDPIELSLDVTPEIGTSFNMDVLVKDTLVEGNSIKTTGLVNVVVPKQFAVSSQDGSVSKDPDGSSRITIKDVNLDENKKPISYSLSLKFDGSGYGVLHTTLGSDYKYLYVDEGGDPLSVKLNFPQPVVGIKAVAREFSFSLPGTSTSATILEISKEFKNMTKYADDNYDVTPEFLLFDESGKLVSNLVDNNYNITNDNYKATLMRGSDNIEYIPLNAGDYTLYYQIRLHATKPGSDKSFNLSSEIMPIKITVAGTPTSTASTGTSVSGTSLGGEGGGLPVQLPLGAVVIAGVSFGLFDRRKKRGEHEKTR